MRRARARSVDWCAWGSHRINLWRRDRTGEIQAIPFRCKSWRCPECRPLVGFVDYARVAAGLCSRERWLYAVLTLPGEKHSNPDRWTLYRDAGIAWRHRLLEGLRRTFGTIEYVQTWEAHASGVPHVNVAFRGDRLFEEVDRQGKHAPRRNPKSARQVLGFRTEFRSRAMRAGFGEDVWIEETWTPRPGSERPIAGLASYMVKLAHSLGIERPERTRGETLASELTRAAQKAKDQTPITAPPGFRRLRATPRLLPPRYRGDPEWTGKLGPSSDPPWSWGVVENVEGLRLRKLEEAGRTLENLTRQGLPIPECVRRLLDRWGRDTSRTPNAPSAGSSSLAADSGSTGSTITRSESMTHSRT